MTKVFAFPPVGVIARYWTMEQPVSRSLSLLSGASYVSAAQRRRLVAGCEIHGRRHYGSGYLEALWRLLDGGVHLVRLTSCRIPWGATVPAVQRSGGFFEWTTPPTDFTWSVPPGEFTWFQGAELYFTASGTEITINGLPPNAVVAIPGEFVTIWNYGETQSETIMIAAEARSNGAGVVTIRLVRPPELTGRISIGTRESGVFEVTSSWPAAMRRVGMTDAYSLAFRQVFEDERGPFEEIDPWS